jgi:hypothetical protein
MKNLVIYSVKHHRCFQPDSGTGHTADKSVASCMRCMGQNIAKHIDSLQLVIVPSMIGGKDR